jgi:hypothetical protein
MEQGFSAPNDLGALSTATPQHAKQKKQKPRVFDSFIHQ